MALSITHAVYQLSHGFLCHVLSNSEFIVLCYAGCMWISVTHTTTFLQEAQLSLTNHVTLFCKVFEVLQDILSENVDKKFTTQVPNYFSAFDNIILLQFYN